MIRNWATALPSFRPQISGDEMRKIWPFSFYFLYFAGIAAFAPYLVLYYQSKGLSGTQIGLLTGIIPLITLFSVPFWTSLADSTGWNRLIMSVTLFAGIATLILFPFLEAFVLIFGLAIVFQIFFSPVVAFADSATMFMLGTRKDLYGRVRLGGTFGFGLTSAVAGLLVEERGLRMAFWGAAALFFLAFLVSQQLVHGITAQKGALSLEKVRTLIQNPHWLIFMVLAFTGGMAFSVSNAYFFPFMKELGASEGTMGLALTLGTLAEIPVMLFVNRMIIRFKSYGLLILALVFSAIRMLLFAISFTPIFAMLAQLINGLTFPIMWVAGVSYADERAPEGMRTTAQGMFSAMVSGIGSAAGGFLGGLLLTSVGGRGLYLIFGLAVFVILALVSLLRKKLPPEPVRPIPEPAAPLGVSE